MLLKLCVGYYFGVSGEVILTFLKRLIMLGAAANFFEESFVI